MKLTQIVAVVAEVCTMLVAVAVTAAATAQAQWPDKPIKLVVPYTPGGGTDTVSRHIAEKIMQDTQWLFVIDNRPGGSGNIGLDFVAKSRPDGLTFGMGQSANLAINPAIMKMPFDPAKDVIPVALIAELPLVMVVKTDSPWKSFADAITAMKAKPGAYKQALAGLGTVGHLAGELLAKRTDTKVLNVPYKGAGPALAEVMGGQTDFMFATPQAVLGLIKGGKLRALAVTSSARNATLPQVPTVAESGYKDFEAIDWKVIVAPAGTSTEVMKRFNAAIEKALARPAMVTQLELEGSAAMGGSPERAAAYIKSEQAKWGTLIREAGIKLE